MINFNDQYPSHNPLKRVYLSREVKKSRGLEVNPHLNLLSYIQII